MSLEKQKYQPGDDTTGKAGITEVRTGFTLWGSAVDVALESGPK